MTCSFLSLPTLLIDVTIKFFFFFKPPAFFNEGSRVVFCVNTARMSTWLASVVSCACRLNCLARFGLARAALAVSSNDSICVMRLCTPGVLRTPVPNRQLRWMSTACKQGFKKIRANSSVVAAAAAGWIISRWVYTLCIGSSRARRFL